MAGLDGLTGSSSFGAARFWIIQAAGMSVPRSGRTARYQRDPIPYGNNATLQIGGYDDDPVSLSALIKTSDWPTLRGLVGTKNTVNLLGESKTALLASATDPQAYKDGYSITKLQFVY